MPWLAQRLHRNHQENAIWKSQRCRSAPRRLNAEKQTLARLTGWRMNEIDALPGALRFAGVASPGDTPPPSSTLPALPDSTSEPWWEQRFKTGSARQTGSGTPTKQANSRVAS